MSSRSEAAGTGPGSQPPPRALSAKVVIAGGFGVGKTTMVGAVSEIAPLRTEAAMTSRARGIDDGHLVAEKTTTTVAMDFGRITIDSGLVLYLFGTPGQDRFGFMWDDVTRGALGAIVLVDTRRLDDCYNAIDYFEERGIPFVVAVNQFAGAPRHDLAEVRYALNIADEVPLIEGDARSTPSVKAMLVALLDHLLERLEPSAPTGPLPAEHAPFVPPNEPPGAPRLPGPKVGLSASDVTKGLRAIERERESERA